jgi:hypothetical protein
MLLDAAARVRGDRIRYLSPLAQKNDGTRRRLIEPRCEYGDRLGAVSSN